MVRQGPRKEGEAQERRVRQGPGKEGEAKAKQGKVQGKKDKVR